MNVLMIMNGNGIGGAELQFIELANQLVKQHHVTMVCMHGSTSVEEGRLDPRAEVLRFAYASGKRAPGRILAAIRACRKRPADAIVTTAFIGNIVGRAAAMGRGTRLVSLQTVSGRDRFKAVDRSVLRGFDVLVAGCQDIREFLLDHGQDDARIEVVNNWVNFSARVTTESREDTRARFGLAPEETVIGCIGRMHPQKGQEYLIRAFKQISDQVPAARLVLVGDGPTMAAMQAEVADHPRILMTGTITGADYTNLLAAFDIYAQPSRWEGLPRTLLDAMYMGLPIVATGVNGNRDALRDGENGLMVPAEDADALAEALLRLLPAPDLAAQLGAQAARDARDHFSMQTQTGRIATLLAAG